MVQGLLALGLLVVANVYLAKAQPYEHRELNLLDVIQATVVSLTIFGGLFFGTASLAEQETVALAIVLLVLNFGFLGLWAWHFAREMLRIARQQRHIGAAIATIALATARFKERARSGLLRPTSRALPKAVAAPVAPEPAAEAAAGKAGGKAGPAPASGAVLALGGGDEEERSEPSSGPPRSAGRPPAEEPFPAFVRAKSSWREEAEGVLEGAAAFDADGVVALHVLPGPEPHPRPGRRPSASLDALDD